MNASLKELTRLYRNRDGFWVPDEAELPVERANSSAMYGELMPTASLRLLEHLRLGPRDTFYDLGSGVGKLVLLAGMTTPARAVGVELVEPRHLHARGALDHAVRQGLVPGDRLRFLLADFMKVDLSDATAIYTCSTAFPPLFLRRLVRHLAQLVVGLKFVTLQDLEPQRWFQKTAELRLDTNWRRRSRVHVYRLVRRRVASR